MSILLFNNDLRLEDNQALVNACNNGAIIPVFILDENLNSYGSANKVWLHHALDSLNKSLDGNLLLFKGDTATILLDVIEQSDTNNVYWNRVYEPKYMNYFTQLKKDLEAKYINTFSFNSSLLIEPQHLLKDDGKEYKVFTPFYKKAMQMDTRFVEPTPSIIKYTVHDIKSLKLEDLNLLPKDKTWHIDLANKWDISEKGAQKSLDRFIDQNVEYPYMENRDIPVLQATSMISAYLRYGQISPNIIVQKIENAKTSANAANFDGFIRQVMWREFCYYLLYFNNNLDTVNFNSKFDNFRWNSNPDLLKRWQTGTTGIPLVDAGMRQLYQTGYMHNRVRMVVASFLCKNLLLNWQEGLKWFNDTLFDADLANNSAGWQWVAGTGADAAPYFRVFNPITQSIKFDKDAEYIKTYVPELKKIPAKYIHEPSTMPIDVANTIGFNLEKDYFKPVADLKETRLTALERYEEIK